MSIRACEEASMILPLGEYEEEAEYLAESLQGPEDHEPHNCAKGTIERWHTYGLFHASSFVTVKNQNVNTVYRSRAKADKRDVTTPTHLG